MEAETSHNTFPNTLRSRFGSLGSAVCDCLKGGGEIWKDIRP